MTANEGGRLTIAMPPHLTIAIPTYNRPAELRQTLEALLPQLTPACTLRIVDNCSETEAAVVLNGVRHCAPGEATIDCVRNVVNVGGGANIVRCFELCDTDWLWILGDDDLVSPTAISLLLEAIRDAPQGCLYIHFGSATQSTVTEGVIELLRGPAAFGSLLFMSTAIYRASHFRQFARFGYQFLYSMAPHLAMLLTGLPVEGQCLFSPHNIIDSPSRGRTTWCPIVAALGKTSLVDLPLPLDARKVLYRIVTAKPSLEYLTATIILGSQGAGVAESVFVYNLLISRLCSNSRSPFLLVRSWIYRGLVYMSWLARPFVAMGYEWWRRRRARAGIRVTEAAPGGISWDRI